MSTSHQLILDGFVKNQRFFTLEQLEKDFEKVEIVAAMQSTGNRRKSTDTKEAEVIKWGDGSLTNAKWTGYRLRDIIDAVGVSDEHKGKPLYVCFASEAASGEEGPSYGASVPVDLAQDRDRAILLATHMNGTVLSPNHGFPLRLIIPGYPGVRWVKWLQRITISDKDYKALPSHVDTMLKDQSLWKNSPVATEIPINSAIATVQSTKSPSSVLVKGYALGDIRDVEVSTDKGISVHKAKLTYREGPWSWIMWECEVPVAEEGKEATLEVWSRAISKGDGSGSWLGRWEGKAIV